MRILHVGCGRKMYDAKWLMDYVGLRLPGVESAQIVHLDADPALQPDIVCRLGSTLIAAPDDEFEIVIAWHVLEHVGKQGESAEWFQCWQELYRVLKPGGLLYGESPSYTGIWAWSDPTHSRAISEHSFVFFSQDAYRIASSPISPYRIACDFQWASMPGMERGHALVNDPTDERNVSLRFALCARKPLKPWWEDADAA